MTIVKSRGGMAAILASLALASTTAFAQAPGGGAPRGGGFGGPATKESVIQRNGLGDAALKLTDAQKAAIDKLAEKNAADSTALQAKYPTAQGSPPSAEATAARTKLREDFTAEVNKVLTPEQQKTWAARPQGGPGGGMGGPPGGGMGGPPGGMGGPPPGGA
jgi:Spy/CpxP family protein refolding chaperone